MTRIKFEHTPNLKSNAMKTLRSLIVLVSIVLLSGCDNESIDNTTPTLIDESAGSYTYTGWFFSGTSWSNRVDINGTLTVSNSGENITIVLDGNETVQVSSVVFAQHSDKYGFDIEASSFTDANDNTIDRFGWGDMIMEHQPYDGLYDGDLGQLFLTFVNSQASEPETHFFIDAVKD